MVVNLNGAMLTDRSACELDDKCGMARWWNRHEGTRGIVPVGEIEALKVGSQIHEDLEWAANEKDLSQDTITAYCLQLACTLEHDARQEDKEILYRRMGWLAAYALYIEPRVRATYENVTTEDELILNRDPLWVAVTPDRILRNKQTGGLVYREYKSTISASYKWLNSWKRAIQLHVGMKAVEEELGQKVQFAQIMGLMKGDNKNGRLIHPYVWGWYSQSKDAWTHEYNKARGSDWMPRPVWEYAPGIVKWVQLCGEDEALAQFPHSDPVFLNDMMLEDWVGRRTHRERVIREVVDNCRESWENRVIYFEPRTSQCEPAYGFQCPYVPLCWSMERRSDPLARGDFKPRQPHHIIELTLV